MSPRPTLGIAVLLCALVCFAPGARAQDDVVVLPYAGPIGPASAEYLSNGIAQGASANAAAIVIELDTPGGLDSSMRQIVQAEMNSRVPVIVFVAPRGARAASAGCFIVLAADVAAMAPGTNIGAAHPIYVSGATVSEKILNDAAAYARSLAGSHQRNSAWAERAVRESVSATAREALSLGVIDLTANDLPDLFSKLQGRVVHMAAGDVNLSLAGARTSLIQMDARERLLAFLTDPTVAYLLLLLGILAIVVEIFAPHGFVTGTIGGVALVLALVGLMNLPVQVSGLALLALAIVLLGLELKITSHGILTILGLVAFVFGSILLLPRMPGFAISRVAIAFVTLAWAVMLGAVVRLVLRARLRPVLTGVHRVVGSTGVAKTDLSPRGVVLVNGEDWDALADAPPVARGERVTVTMVDGLTAHVRKS